MKNTPILYSFRRCPYAMRARMALSIANIGLEHREILLKNKPPHMLAVSPKGTVPVLILQDNSVIDESIDVMRWALQQSDPEDWLVQSDTQTQSDMDALIAENDSAFKDSLDRYKYADRHPQYPPEHYRDEAELFLQTLEHRLTQTRGLCADRTTFADVATMPFVRQFAHVDKQWFDKQPLPKLQAWLESWLKSDLFTTIMKKHALWGF